MVLVPRLSGRQADLTVKLSSLPAAVNNSLLEENQPQVPGGFGRPGVTVEERLHGW